MRYGLPKFSGFLDPSACVQDPSAPALMSIETQKLLEAISHSKLVQIGRLRWFLASTFSIDAKKHLKRLI